MHAVINCIVTELRCYGGHLEWQKREVTCEWKMIYSKYYEELNTVAQKRYREKLKIAGLSRDPYVSKDFSTGNSQLWPQVEYPDIFNYLIKTRLVLIQRNG